jgi:hypothetical protein
MIQNLQNRPLQKQNQETASKLRAKRIKELKMKSTQRGVKGSKSEIVEAGGEDSKLLEQRPLSKKSRRDVSSFFNTPSSAQNTLDIVRRCLEEQIVQIHKDPKIINESENAKERDEIRARKEENLQLEKHRAEALAEARKKASIQKHHESSRIKRAAMDRKNQKRKLERAEAKLKRLSNKIQPKPKEKSTYICNIDNRIPDVDLDRSPTFVDKNKLRILGLVLLGNQKNKYNTG